ncbi:uncharacterized protein LOC135384792 [Ornithodoros turicata]|uniref:uncharacterized protein LOC135384792 n=1 Tax=Ornithodoros turicata TaxID=34597 RepID=UPI003138F163
MEVYSDNGPQFLSKEFRDFGTLFDFVHVTSSPRFPRSSGLAEKGVQIVKRILKKSTYANTNFFLGLLNYRTTPLEDGNSLADILMGRRLRSRLPDFGSASQVDVRKHRQNGAWTVKAKVQDRLAPRSYKVVTEDNKVLRGNRQHLLPTSEHCVRTTPAMGDLSCTGSKPFSEVLTGSSGLEQAAPSTSGASSRDSAPLLTKDSVTTQGLSLRRSTRTRRPPDRLMFT